MRNLKWPFWFLCVALVVGCGGDKTASDRTPAGLPSEDPGSQADGATPQAAAVEDSEDPGTQNGLPHARDSQGDSLPGAESEAVKDMRDWMADLASDDKELRSRASEHFDAMRGAEAEHFLAMLTDESVAVRRGAAFGLLGRFDPSVPEMTEAFFAALNDRDRTVRSIALQAVSEMPPKAMTPALPHLTQLLLSADVELSTRTRVARMLGQMGPEAADALPALCDMVRKDPQRAIRAVSFKAVCQIDTDAQLVIPLAIEVLDSDEAASMRRNAALGLARLGPKALQATDDLAAALADEDEGVARAAADALVHIGPRAVRVLVAQFDAQQPAVKILAISAVARIGPAGKAALPELRKRLKDEDQDVRRAAEAAIFWLMNE